MSAPPNETKPPIRVFLVDDHPVVREGLTQLIGSERDMTVCGQAQTAAEARAALPSSRADVAVVDISLENGSGMDLIKDIRDRFVPTRVLVFSMHKEAIYAERAVRAGALGYVMKGQPPECIIEAIRKVASGEVCLSPETSQRILRRMACENGRACGSGDLCALTDREIEVFQMIGEGLTPKEIAQRLHLSRKTIEAHRENIKRKLDCGSSLQLIQMATRALERNSL